MNDARPGGNDFLVVIQGVNVHSDPDLALIVKAFDSAAFFLGLGEGGEKHSGQDGDDGNDNE